MSERLWFQAAIEGLWLRGVGKAMTPELKADMRGVGIDLDNLLPAYKAEIVLRAVDLTLAKLYPGQEREAALAELGRVFTRGYAETFIGGAMMQLLRVIGPRRSLERLERSLRSGGNYMETRFTAIDSRSAKVWLNDVAGMAGLYVGIVEEGGRRAGAKSITVTAEPGVNDECTLFVQWTE